MADNYLENKFEELKKGTLHKTTGKKATSLESLLTKNRSYRGYDPQATILHSTLTKIVSVNTKIASAKNQQVLRFKLVTKESGADKILENIRLGGALPELHLPFIGTEPNAFIIICSTIGEDRMVDIDLGISAQSMLLRATEMGLNGIMICNFNKEQIKSTFRLPYEPLMIIAIGKGTEDIRLTTIAASESHKYYRENGIHYVPKIQTEDIIIH